MTTLTTTWFKDNHGSISFSTPKQVGVAFYTRTPDISNADQAAAFATVTSLASLDSRPEWVKVRGTVPTVFPSTTTKVSSLLYLRSESGIGSTDNIYLKLVYNSVGSTYLPAEVDNGIGWTFSPSSPETFVQDVASVAVIYLVGTYSSTINPVIAVTDQGIGDSTVVHDGSLFGQLLATSNYLLMVERLYESAVLKRFNVVAGYTTLVPSEPRWESSHAHHLWLEPQRTNFAANPSFTNVNGNVVSHWRTNGSLSLVGGAGKLTSASTGTVLESNFFPRVGEWLSISFSARTDPASSATVDIEYGVVLFDASHTKATWLKAASATVGPSATYIRLTGLVNVPDTAQMCFRLKVTSGSADLYLDDVLLDPHESQYTYFDGNSNHGLPGDFRWVGGVDYANKHFSCWYNNYTNTRNRLMGDYDTDDDLYKPGLVEDWAPQGANVVAHWDAVTSFTPLNWMGDAFYPISNVAGSTVTNVS